MALLIYLLTFIICSAFVFMAGAIIFYLIIELGKREIKRENEYYLKCKEIQNLIRNWPATLINHDALLIMLNDLKELKHKDRKKTSDLTNEFSWHYRAIAKQRAKEPCKSSAEAVFKS